MSDVQEPNEPEDLHVPESPRSDREFSDAIVRHARKLKITPAQLEESERRLQAFESDPRACVSWEELRARLESELRNHGSSTSRSD